MVNTRFSLNMFNINTMTSDLNRCDFELFTWEISIDILDNERIKVFDVQNIFIRLTDVWIFITCILAMVILNVLSSRFDLSLGFLEILFLT